MEDVNIIDCQKIAIFFQFEHELFNHFLGGFDVRCKNDDIIHYAINVFTNI